MCTQFHKTKEVIKQRRFLIKSFLAIILLGVVILMIALVIAPMVQAQSGQPDTPLGKMVELIAPLPLPVSGSVDVNNFPDTQNVSGSVNIINLPPAREPVQVLANHDCSANSYNCEFVVYTVPTGKRLVIEYISFYILRSSITTPIVPGIRTTLGGTSILHEISPNPIQTSVLGVTKYVFGKNVKLYADPDTEVGALIRHPYVSTPGYDFTVSISGYLEAVP